MKAPPLRATTLVVFVLLAGARPAAAWDSPAPDVVLYCTPALASVLGTVAHQYTAETGVKVHIFLAPPDGLIGLIKHRARDDVVVADTPTLQALADEKLLRAGSIVALGNDPFVLIAKASEPPPAGTDAAALAAARPIVLPDPTTAATFDGAAVLHAALPGTTMPPPIGVSDTPEVIDAIREDGHSIGLVHRTEAGAPGLTILATLATPPTPTAGALVANGQSANAAALLQFIAGPKGHASLRSAGMEPSS